jgi:hypothetical protein
MCATPASYILVWEFVGRHFLFVHKKGHPEGWPVNVFASLLRVVFYSPGSRYQQQNKENKQQTYSYKSHHETSHLAAYSNNFLNSTN